MQELICPLCKHNQCKYFSKYPGSFFEISDLIECNNCKLVYAHKMPEKKDLENYYTSGAYYNHRPDHGNLKVLNYIFNQSASRFNLINTYIKFGNIKNVIDIGAGYAKFGKVLKDHCPELKYDVVEADFNLKSTWGKWINNCFTEISNLENRHYDLSIVSHILEHIIDPAMFINSIIKKMKPNGYIFLEVPYKDYLYKKSVSPHITFWNQKSIEFLSKELNLNLLFIDTNGISHKKAKLLVTGNPELGKDNSFLKKLKNPYNYIDKVKDFTGLVNLPVLSDNFIFRLNKYGGDRIYLRAILKKEQN